MTPERAKWWDSLPLEEKMARIQLGSYKHCLSVQKEHLTDLNTQRSNPDEIRKCKKGIYMTKVRINVMRKLITMDVLQVGRGEYAYSCPTCHARMSWREAYNKEFRCGECGQKLRWK